MSKNTICPFRKGGKWCDHEYANRRRSGKGERGCCDYADAEDCPLFNNWEKKLQ